MEVLVPGYGVHGIEETKLSSPSVPPLAPPVLDLAIMLDEYEDEEDNLEGLVPLLEVIGAHTTNLAINMQPEDLDIDATSIPDILHACPRLQYLEMEHVTCDGLECLVDAFEDDECQLTALSLNGVMCGDDTESLDMGFDALKVSNTRIAMQLQELHIRTNTSSRWLAHQLRDVLDVNRTLHPVIMTSSQEAFDATTHIMQDPTPIYMNTPQSPFPHRSELVFLSVLYDTDSSTCTAICEALTVLNKTMYQQIFEYASPAMNRVAFAVEDWTLLSV